MVEPYIPQVQLTPNPQSPVPLLMPVIADPYAWMIDNPSEQALDLLNQAKALPANPRLYSGLFSKKHRLPRDCQWLADEMESIQGQLLDAVQAKHGEVSVYHSSVIETVLKHHKRQRLLERWLVRPMHQNRNSHNDPDEVNRTRAIPLVERIRLVKEESLASESRAKAIKLLGLSESVDDSPDWTKIFAAGAQAGVSLAKNEAAIESKPSEGG